MSYDKYHHKSISHSPYGKIQEPDIDPYSPVIVEDLLQGLSEWRGTQEIVKLTFKALTDVVKAQGETLRELERQMPSRASKAELNSGLALKANISDVSRTIAEVVSSLDGKISAEDIQVVLKDYVLRADFQYILSNKASIDEVKTLLETRVGENEFRTEIQSLANKFDDYFRDSQRRLTNLVTQREFQALSSTVELKANLSEITEQLESKANKQSVANALHRKANRADIEALLARKTEQTDFLNLLASLDGKADLISLDKLAEIVECKADKSELNLLNSAISNKADRTEVDFLASTRTEVDHKFRDVERKVENLREEIENNRQSLSQKLSKKAESGEIDRIVQIITKKADGDHVNTLVSELKHEIAEDVGDMKTELNQFKRHLEETLLDKQQKSENFNEKLSEEVYRLNDQLKNILEERRNDIEETAKFVKNISNTTKKEFQGITDQILSEVDETRKIVEDLMNRKVDKKEWVEWRAKINVEIESKVDLNEVQAALNQSQADISTRFAEHRDEVKNMVRNHENELYGIVAKKATMSDINTALAQKADTTAVHSLLAQKASTIEIDELKRKLDHYCHSSEEKLSARDYETQTHHIKRVLDEVQKELLLKANIKDVCTLLDAKANIDEVNKALVEIHKELDTKPTQEELGQVVHDQGLINESLCTENILGRWAWKSGILKSGSLVPWEIQLANTLPDNFLWEKDKSSIMTVAPGLYEITLGFFAKKRPSIQFLINGETVFSALNSHSNIVPTPAKKEIELVKGSSPTGLSLVDFLVLPEKARISIVYNGESEGEGFIGLKRL